MANRTSPLQCNSIFSQLFKRILRTAGKTLVFFRNNCISSLQHLFLKLIKSNNIVFETNSAKSFCINPIPHGGGEGGPDSALLQILFFITCVRDAAEPRNLVTFPTI